MKVAAAGAVTVWFVGCAVIVGGGNAGGVAALTVSVAGLLVWLPDPLVTTTWKLNPLSARVVGEIE